MNLTTNSIISISVNSAIFVVLVVASIILINRLKMERKGYKYLFWLYTIFWIPIMLVRPYRGTMQTAIDPNFYTIAIISYGAIGIFIRIFADIISYFFKYRKYFLYFCAISELALFIPLIISPSTPTNILSSIGIGIGASCIGTYELLFQEQYGNDKAFLTVSILAIPPLLANFLTAPIQSIIKTVSTVNGQTQPGLLRYMWVIALPFIVIAFIMLIFLHEKPFIKPITNTPKFHNLPSSQRHDIIQNWIFFVNIAIIGSIVAFIKFTNSDALATTHLQNLAKLNGLDSSSYEGYLSVIFSLFQLLSSVLLGLYFVKKMKLPYVFIIGSGSWFVYHIAASFITNPIAYMGVHSLNGFGYGVLYNLVLGVVLGISTQNKVVTKMGWYQSILSIGITFSGFYTNWIKNSILPNKSTISEFTLSEYMHIYLVQNMILVGVILFITIWFIILFIFIDKYSKSNNNSKKTNKTSLKASFIFLH